MSPEVFTTVGIPREMQVQAWRGLYESIFDVSVDDPSDGFCATAETWNWGKFGLSRVDGPRVQAARTAALIRRNPVDHWIVAVGRRRTTGEVARRGPIDIPAGVPFVASLGREIVSLRDEDCRLQLYLPRDHFAEFAAVLDDAEGRPITGAAGRLLADFLALLERNAPTLTEASLPGLQSAIQGMLLGCIAPSMSRDDAGKAAIAVTRREKVRRIVDSNLRNRSLGVAFLCREAGMSRSQLYRLLESEGGVAGFIQRRRLRQSFVELSGQMKARPIADTAKALCFEDPSSFSRSFRREFGISPSDVAHAARSGAPIGITDGDRARSDRHRFRHLLDHTARA